MNCRKGKNTLMFILIVMLGYMAIELFVIFSPYEIPILSFFFPSSKEVPLEPSKATDEYCGPYSKDLNLYVRIDKIEGNLWRAYINTENPGADSDYVEFSYLLHEGQPGIGLCFPDDDPNMIYVTDFGDHVKTLKSHHFQIRRVGGIDKCIGPKSNEDSLSFAYHCQTIMIGSYIPQVMLNDDMTGWRKYLHRVE